MARTTRNKTEANRAAIYARVSDKSQDGEDKTSISEQTGEMEAYCQDKGLTITARYQEVGRGWSKKRPEFQRMLADARKERFDVIVCWKSDRLSRGMYPAAALMEVVEAHQIRLEAVMDAIDMKTFGLMAAIGKIELDNFRERSTLGKRGTAKQGRVPTGKLPYGYRIGDDGRAEVIEEQAEAVRRIFQMYVHEGMWSYSIAVRLTDDGIPTQSGKPLWLQSRVHHILGNAAYTGTWLYGKYRHVSTEDGMKIYDQPEDTWIEIPIPQIIDDETWERAQALKKQRSRKAKRNTKVLYQLQHLLKCGECGHNFHARAAWTNTSVRNGKKYQYELDHPPPLLHVQRDAEHAPGLPGASPHPGRAVGRADLERGEAGDPEPRPDRRRYRHPRCPGGRRPGGGDSPGGKGPAEHPDGRGPGHQAVRVGEDHRGPSSTFSAGSSPSGWRAPGRGWTITGLGRLAESRSGG